MRIKSPYGNNDFSDYKKVKESKETKEQKHFKNIKSFFSGVFDWIKILFYIIGWTIFIMLIVCVVITIGVIFVHLFGSTWLFIANGNVENYLFNTVIPFITSEDFFAGFIMFGFLYEAHYLIHGLIKLLYKEHNEYVKDEKDRL